MMVGELVRTALTSSKLVSASGRLSATESTFNGAAMLIVCRRREA